jgi:hypothetical protein
MSSVDTESILVRAEFCIPSFVMGILGKNGVICGLNTHSSFLNDPLYLPWKGHSLEIKAVV